ncbi:MAG TPA: CDP-diacylglycerol--serine O-phosphatidyltransferase [Actinophytocola sp.]|nr:CDP-diacylglycerol--serine O-phosphatidyltransferase [Actinophytocola sp.]
MVSRSSGVRFLPNAITVLAMCAGLSAVQFTLSGNLPAAIASIAVAAVLDSLDGRIARLLDATSKMGAELDSLADAISFGVAPALVLYIWKFDGNRVGWVVALVFAVCIILRLARFNTLLDDTEQPPYAKEFFVGVPAPAGGLLALLPLILTIQVGRDGWWSAGPVVMVWTVAIGALLISRIPTLSLKTFRVPARLVAPLLVLVGLLAAAVVTYPMLALAAFLVLYLLHVPYAVRRNHWLANHPEAWDVPPRERRAIRRAAARPRPPGGWPASGCGAPRTARAAGRPPGTRPARASGT